MQFFARFSVPLFIVLSAASTALGDSKNITGRYLDVDGDPIDIQHQGAKVTLRPDASGRDLPPQAKQVLGDLKVQGTIRPNGEGFDIDAAYEHVLEPNPNVKMKFKVLFDANAHPTEGGLHMKSCEWDFTMVIFSGGEIAGSENKKEKCVGLWKKP